MTFLKKLEEHQNLYGSIHTMYVFVKDTSVLPCKCGKNPCDCDCALDAWEFMCPSCRAKLLLKEFDELQKV